MSLLRTLLTPVRKTAGKFLGKGHPLPKELIIQRLRKCDDCVFLYRPTYSCKQCACFADEKARYSGERCPIGRW